VTPNSLRRRRRIAGVACVVAFAVGGCGSILYPGTAAVVDGQAISQGTVDDLVMAACNYTKVKRIAAGRSTPGTSIAYLRTAITNELIGFALRARAARQLGLSVTEAAIAKVEGGTTMPKPLSAHDKQLLLAFFHDSVRAELEEALIGAHLKNPKVTSAAHVTAADKQAAARYLKSFFKRQQVSVNPAYGRWNGTALQPVSGSLSDAVSAGAKADENAASNPDAGPGTPATEVCG
jgi:SurA N-terminal domain